MFKFKMAAHPLQSEKNDLGGREGKMSKKLWICLVILALLCLTPTLLFVLHLILKALVVKPF